MRIKTRLRCPVRGGVFENVWSWFSDTQQREGRVIIAISKHYVVDIITCSIMNLFKSPKSGSKSSSRWSEWEWSEDYQKEWRQRQKPNGMRIYFLFFFRKEGLT